VVAVTDLGALLIDLVIIAVFIAGIAQFRTPKGARNGNITTAVAFGAAIALVLARNHVGQPGILIPAFLLGGAIGWFVSARVTMTRIPALVALQNGAGGGASLMVSLVELTRTGGETFGVSTLFAYVGIMVGGVALAGSVVAAGKLEGKISPRPVVLSAHNPVLLLIILLAVIVSIVTLSVAGPMRTVLLVGLALLALLLGIVFSVRVGGADMPVLISFLNALSGLAAAFVGVAVQNQMLIAAGAMVGSSGLILTLVMCTAMNRTLTGVLTGSTVTRAPAAFASSADIATTSVLIDGVTDEVVPQPAKIATASVATDAGQAPPEDASGAHLEPETAVETASDTDPLARARAALDAATSVIVVPGYGMALAHAQFEVAQLAEQLEAAGKTVRFAVHPVAGRMPGHMHVLLAEAEIDYEKLFEMDAINDNFAETDVVLVVGACDVVNPAAISQEGTPISGMPILKAYEARAVIVCNLDEKPGYSGVPNPLYDDPKAILLFGDAKETVTALMA
jgi:NAD(P) transhydrogenase subunit beta